MRQLEGTTFGAGAGSGPGSAAAEPAAARGRARVLLVDDQPARLLTYEAILAGMDLECVRASSGPQALEQLLAQEFAVILLDVEMPGMNGFEVARLVREHPRLERTPIIFVTGVHVSEFDRLKGYEVGAIDYIAVPVIPEILRSKVALLVELYLRRSELQALANSSQQARGRLDAERTEQLAGREALLRGAFENPDCTTVILRAQYDADGAVSDWIYLDANGNTLAALGLTRDALLGRALSTVLPGERAERAAGLCAQVLASGEPIRYESEFAGKHLLITIFPGGPDTVVSSGVDITARKRVEAALNEADRRKDEFLAMLAHELRNPLAPISNAAEVLGRLLARDEKSRPLIAMIKRQGAHLSRILDDLLDIARITQGRIELRREAVAVPACIELAVETVQPLMRAKDQQLTVSRTATPLIVSADKVRLEQCVANLLTNAVQYTDAGGEIRVRAHAEAGEACITVSDTGIGIPLELQPRVFDLFWQHERTLDRAQGGLGVGLSISKQLIEMHGGTLSCSSAGLGRGATFTIRLPLLEGCADAAPHPLEPPKQRVLVVDDNRDAADSLAMCLQLEGHEAVTAYSAESALGKVVELEPQVVLLDIGLPHMDGYECARRIRALGRNVRLIALSGYSRPEEKQQPTESAFDARLTKPTDVATLKSLFAAPR